VRKFLLKLFSKSLRGGGAAPSIAAFFFFESFFLLRLLRQKKKATDKSSWANSLLTCVNLIAAFSLQSGGAKKEA